LVTFERQKLGAIVYYKSNKKTMVQFFEKNSEKIYKTISKVFFYVMSISNSCFPSNELNFFKIIGCLNLSVITLKTCKNSFNIINLTFHFFQEWQQEQCQSGATGFGSHS
jgi:hypothetical protein